MSSDISKDATEAAVKWSLDKVEKTVSDLIYKFRNRQLLFLQDKEEKRLVYIFKLKTIVE